MKCIVQFKGELSGAHENVIHWKEFLEMGKVAGTPSKSGRLLNSVKTLMKPKMALLHAPHNTFITLIKHIHVQPLDTSRA